jgi:hypothetical protein
VGFSDGTNCFFWCGQTSDDLPHIQAIHAQEKPLKSVIAVRSIQVLLATVISGVMSHGCFKFHHPLYPISPDGELLTGMYGKDTLTFDKNGLLITVRGEIAWVWERNPAGDFQVGTGNEKTTVQANTAYRYQGFFILNIHNRRKVASVLRRQTMSLSIDHQRYPIDPVIERYSRLNTADDWKLTQAGIQEIIIPPNEEGLIKLYFGPRCIPWPACFSNLDRKRDFLKVPKNQAVLRLEATDEGQDREPFEIEIRFTPLLPEQRPNASGPFEAPANGH